MVLRARLPTLVLALLGTLVCAACHGDGETGGPAARGNLLLVVLDTARADHFSSYGYERDTTPNFDRLAAEGERYEQAWAQSSWTLPAMASILTGQPPHVHGAGRGRDGMFGLDPDVPTVAEHLSRTGFRTAAFVNVVWCSPNLSSLDRGFDLYDFQTSDESNRDQRDARRTTDAALAWLRGAEREPFFLVLHYFDPHLTYDAPAPFDTMFEPEAGPRIPRGFGSASEVFDIRKGRTPLDDRHRRSLIARYDGELRFTDEQFGRLRAGMERLGLWDETLVVVVADHGEEFWDHGGFEHGHSHHREVLRVPLIVRRPGGAPTRVFSGRVRQIDIAPTLLSFAGVESRDDLPGRELGGEGAEFAVAEGTLWAGDLVSARSDRGTLILDRDTGGVRFFSPGDVGEHRSTEPADVDLLRLLRALPPRRGRTDPPRPLTEEQIEQLRSLGYLR